MNIDMSPPIALINRNNINRNIKHQFKLIELGIFMTYDCNLSCKYCPHMGVYNKPKGNKLDLKLLKEKLPLFIDKYSDINMPLGISLSGGEPLIDWDYFKELTYILNEISVPVQGRQITTNLAIELSVEQINYLIQNYNIINVSLDGKYETQEFNYFTKY